MKTIVISVGGSVLIPTLNTHIIHQYATVLKHISKQFRLFIVVGGGGEARKYISVARSCHTDEASCDEIGILVTRLNAQLLIHALGEYAYPKVAENYTDACTFGIFERIVIMGGVTPGQTTDAVSVVLAERVHADILINATSVDGIYSADPKIDSTATRFDVISPTQLVEIVSKGSMGAGSNNVMDLVSVKLVQRCNIPLIVLDGTNPNAIITALEQGTINGTLVSADSISPLPL